MRRDLYVDIEESTPDPFKHMYFHVLGGNPCPDFYDGGYYNSAEGVVYLTWCRIDIRNLQGVKVFWFDVGNMSII